MLARVPVMPYARVHSWLIRGCVPPGPCSPPSHRVLPARVSARCMCAGPRSREIILRPVPEALSHRWAKVQGDGPCTVRWRSASGRRHLAVRPRSLTEEPCGGPWRGHRLCSRPRGRLPLSWRGRVRRFVADAGPADLVTTVKQGAVRAELDRRQVLEAAGMPFVPGDKHA